MNIKNQPFTLILTLVLVTTLLFTTYGILDLETALATPLPFCLNWRTHYDPPTGDDDSAINQNWRTIYYDPPTGDDNSPIINQL